jgi:hypothetical protein
MPILSGDSLHFCDRVWILKLLASKHTQTSIWHARPFASTLYRPAYGLVG